MLRNEEGKVMVGRLLGLNTKPNLDYNSRLSSYRAVNTLHLDYKASHVIQCTEIITLCSEFHTKHQYTL